MEQGDVRFSGTRGSCSYAEGGLRDAGRAAAQTTGRGLSGRRIYVGKSEADVARVGALASTAAAPAQA